MSALLASVCATAQAQTVFVEAETFTITPQGWAARAHKAASALKLLDGAEGTNEAVADKEITLETAGPYHVWVRFYMQRIDRGPFRLAVLRDGKEIAGHDFDLESQEKAPRAVFAWKDFTADLPAGNVVVRLSKYQNENSKPGSRLVDCVLLTTDMKLTPDHLDYGPQTFLRVTLGNGYEKPVYIHVFADHFHAPWYSHWALSKDGIQSGFRLKRAENKLTDGEGTPWCNITPMLYQESGASLAITPKSEYTEPAPKLAATVEFATAADEKAVVRKFQFDRAPSTLIVSVPPNLSTADNVARLKTDIEFATETGKIADSYDWPTVGRKPRVFPFLVSTWLGRDNIAQEVVDREWKTLGYFGFSNQEKDHLSGGIWKTDQYLYSRPLVDKMKSTAAARAEEFKRKGKTLKDIAFCMLMDEPIGQRTQMIVKDSAYQEQFRAWIKELGKQPADLLVDSWDAVKLVYESDRDRLPALHYYTQKYRTVSLDRFMKLQNDILHEAYGGKFPVLVNFSDGIVYSANLCMQGVDYFELLDSGAQNAIWGEDWSNLASSYQCTSYNLELMRAAARKHGQVIGHYLIAFAGRTGWDVRCKVASEAGRGVKMFETFYYGPSWGTHEGGPPWKSSTLYAHPEHWRDNAEAIREIGGAEDLLVPAMPPPAEVAILYSSSSDIWTFERNHAHGFERMHNWMALAHAQVPVDFLSEKYVGEGRLDGYKVCYLDGPNLTRAAGAKLAAWVEAGGTLWLSAGAAMRDEFNRPLDTLTKLLPAERADLEQLQPFLSSGKYLNTLEARGKVTAEKCAMQVLSVKQPATAKPSAVVLARFDDGSPALVRGSAGKGTIYVAGFLPALHYIKSALEARRVWVGEEAVGHDQPEEATIGDFPEARLIKNSYNPWEFPADVREFILQPVRAAKIDPPILCDVPLVDAVYMTCDKGVVIPLANYTLKPIEKLTLRVRVGRDVQRIESVHHGELKYERKGDRFTFSLPLGSSDFLKLYYR